MAGLGKANQTKHTGTLSNDSARCNYTNFTVVIISGCISVWLMFIWFVLDLIYGKEKNKGIAIGDRKKKRKKRKNRKKKTKTVNEEGPKLNLLIVRNKLRAKRGKDNTIYQEETVAEKWLENSATEATEHESTNGAAKPRSYVFTLSEDMMQKQLQTTSVTGE
uniref:Uncharacterized protein n=1 Tax=Trichuris muris TaxID=70415 RepID=A0A5S6QCX1_TRIMR